MVIVHTCSLYFAEKKTSKVMNLKYQRQCRNLEEQGMGWGSLGFFLKLLPKVGQEMCYSEGITRINSGGQKPNPVLLLHLLF